MFQTDLKFAIRNFRKYKIFSFINLTGLVIGITASLLIFMYVINELGFEDVHKNRDRIYRVNVFLGSGDNAMKLGGAMPALAPAAENQIPEVEQAVRFLPAGKTVIQYGEKKFNESDFYYADPSFFKIFTFPIVKGNSVDPLSSPNNIVLTESMSKKIFGNEYPIGKVLKCGDNDLIVTAIAKDIPKNTQLQWGFLTPFTLYEKMNPGSVNWRQFGQCYTYLLTKKDVADSELEKKVNDLYAQNVNASMASLIKLHPQKLSDIYLHSEVFGELGPTGNITYIYVFSSVAVLILFIACFNFINLSTARSMKRAKEVGVKKVLGADRKSLIKQFLGESFLVTGLAVIISAALYEAINPYLSKFLGYEMTVHSIYNIYFYALITGITFIAGLFSGTYPAFVLSRYRPVETLRGSMKSGASGSAMRKILVVFQFAISIFLIAGTFAIMQQLNYLRNADLGFDKSNIVLINFPASSENGESNYELLKNNLLQNSNIKAVSGVYTLPGISSKEQQSISLIKNDDNNDKVIRSIGVDYDFINTIGAKIVEGRNFSDQYVADKDDAVILNQSAVKFLGLKNPVGTTVYLPGGKNGSTREAKVIGVVNDFHVSSLKEAIDPFFLYINPQRFFTVAVKISPQNVQQTIGYMEAEWAKIYPDKKLTYSFMDDDYKQLYSSEEKLSQLFIIFSMLAVFVACLGLFGLSVFTAEVKIKEIGVRKVLGATAANISLMLSKGFVKLVLTAGVIAAPVAYYFINMWLESFAYRITINPLMFVLACGIALIIALATISFQAVKAAIANPIEALRYE